MSAQQEQISFGFDNTYARELPDLVAPVRPAPAPAPRLLYLNEPLAESLGLPVSLLRGDAGAAMFSGNVLPADAAPVAQIYAGHQFGGFSPQLGDGRALLLGEIIDRAGSRRDIAFKGSGRTPFSRNGDGKAAIGPMLRELLIGEAMHGLGIPTTRALAVAATGAWVQRETLLPGAVLTRIAASHLRVGTFQFFAARNDLPRLRALTDYAIARHDPTLIGAPERELKLLRAVAQRQARLIAQWMNVGFIHGVMNTDNMTISGETIDYGPCAFMEAYDPDTVFSSIDQYGRYAYARQPTMARWNLARLAEALLPLMVSDPDDAAGLKAAVAQVTKVIEGFDDLYAAAVLQGQRAKLGLVHARSTDDPADAALAADWLALMHAAQADFTLSWRHLGDAAAGNEAPLRAMFAAPEALDLWLARWRARCARDDVEAKNGGVHDGGATPARAARMHRVNPLVIARNHQVEAALTAASSRGDLQPLHRLLDALRTPFDENPVHATLVTPGEPEQTARYQTFCGT